MRTLVWYLPSPTRTGAVGPVYKLEMAYTAVEVWVVTRAACGGEGLIVDVLVDGSSVFDTRPQVTRLQTEGTGIFLRTLGPLREDSLVSLSVDQLDGTEGDITVGLVLEER